MDELQKGVEKVNERKSSSSGVGFFSLLGIAFIILKLTNTIDWPWVWVTAPIWIPVVLAVIILTIVHLID